jgi:hypothetical protein
VTLGEIADWAGREYSWPTVHAEAKPRTSLLEELAQRLKDAGARLDGSAAKQPMPHRIRVTGGAIEAKAFGVGGSLTVTRAEQSRTAAAQLDAALELVANQAMQRGAGLIVTLDEVHNASADELHVLGAILQEHVPENWPLVVVIAALPSLRTNRGPRKLPTYLERAEWHELGDLDSDEAGLALSEPARISGRPMSKTAVDILLGVTGGYPYAIQVAGQWAWRVSTGAPRITAKHARTALAKIERELVQLFTGRWSDASAKERVYLHALARVTERLGRAPGGGEVATELGEVVTAVSYLRERLITKGTIYAVNGELHFITPGMATWVLAVADAPSQ